MDNIFSILYGLSLGPNNRGEEAGHDIVGDYTIDTCFTQDQGWETAIWKDVNKMAIVQRYSDKEKAEKGHKIWTAFCVGNPVKAYCVSCDKYIEF